MKNYLFPTLLLLFVSLFNVQAQGDEYKSVVTANLGVSGTGLLIGLGDIDIDGESVTFDASVLPSIQLTYDRSLANWFSVGGALSNQTFKFKGSSGTDENEQRGKVNVNRTNLSARALFHYGSNPKLDLYSGFRVGYTGWNLNVKTPNAKLEEDIEGVSGIGGRLTTQLIAFGIRGYFDNNFGLNMEVGLGAPHIVSAGVNYRF